jgi:hypothetical protein
MRIHAAVVLVFLVLPSRAWADDKADCESAFEEGQLARRDGRFDGAREAFAACQAEACPAAMKSRCAEFARDLEAAQPSVVVVVRDADGADVRGATVRVDGAPAVNVSALGLRLNPGSHTLRVEAIDFRPSEKTVTLPEAFKSMPVAFVLERPTLPSSVLEASPRSATAAWAFGIGSGVSLVAAGALSGAGWVMHQSLKSSCGAAGCTESQVEPLRFLWPASFVALGVAVVSGVVATILLVTHSREPVRAALMVTSTTGIRF